MRAIGKFLLGWCRSRRSRGVELGTAGGWFAHPMYLGKVRCAAKALLRRLGAACYILYLQPRPATTREWRNW